MSNILHKAALANQNVLCPCSVPRLACLRDIRPHEMSPLQKYTHVLSPLTSLLTPFSNEFYKHAYC